MMSFCMTSLAQMDMKNMKGMDMSQHKSSKKKVAKKKVSSKKQPVKKPVSKSRKTNMSHDMSNMKMPAHRDTMQMHHDMHNMEMKSGDTMKMDHDMNNMKMDHKDSMPPSHNMGNMKMPAQSEGKSKSDTMKMSHDMKDMKMDDDSKMLMGGEHEPMDMSNMSDPFSLNLPMQRHGSGTSWLPDASPMHAYMFHANKWMYMLHGNIFLRYTKQDISNKGSRGGIKYDAPNWLMFMGQSKVGEKGLFHFSTMFSLDPVTEGGQGYPLLFQSGEAYNGKPIVDRQHPHDLFSELSVSYSHAFSKNVDAFIYVGYPGEPALGPVAFMHRPAAMYDPDAPLSHHWSDATHITFGVATLGVRFGDVKIDGSLFTGREPDDMRYDFDKPKFDSWSGRISFNPTQNWALQVSHGFINSPEQLHPDEDVNRTTASAIFSNGSWNLSAVYGVNKIKDHSGENSFLLEGSKTIKRATFYSRYEYVQKSVEELALDEIVYGHDAVFPVNAFTLGANYDVIQLADTRLSAGSQFTWYHADKKLNSLYGENPMAFEFYLRIYPSFMKKHKM